MTLTLKSDGLRLDAAHTALDLEAGIEILTATA